MFKKKVVEVFYVLRSNVALFMVNENDEVYFLR